MALRLPLLAGRRLFIRPPNTPAAMGRGGDFSSFSTSGKDSVSSTIADIIYVGVPILLCWYLCDTAEDRVLRKKLARANQRSSEHLEKLADYLRQSRELTDATNELLERRIRIMEALDKERKEFREHVLKSKKPTEGEA